MTASEILDKKVTPAQLAKLVMTLRHRPLRRKSAAAAQNSAPAAAGGPVDDDDIPF